jgi:peptidoglycan hydrolase-like protein with peptidoglycan-binding domain
MKKKRSEMADHPVIRKGSKGAAVELAQTNLKARGYDPGAVDGLFGAKTHTAVRRYQTDRDLTVDGVVGARTWARLDPPTVKRGSTGSAVKLLQELLSDYGYDPGAIDSDFGSQTEKALKEFQADYGLATDGLAGPKTWAALGS